MTDRQKGFEPKRANEPSRPRPRFAAVHGLMGEGAVFRPENAFGENTSAENTAPSPVNDCVKGSGGCEGQVHAFKVRIHAGADAERSVHQLVFGQGVEVVEAEDMAEFVFDDGQEVDAIDGP